MSVTSRQKELVEDYGFIENRQERLGAIVDASRHTNSFPESLRTEDHLVKGCTSSVWLVGELRDGLCHFRSDCDSPMVRGLVALLVQAYNGAPPDDVMATEPTVLQELEVWRDLTPTRQNGLNAVRQRLADLARSWS